MTSGPHITATAGNHGWVMLEKRLYCRFLRILSEERMPFG